MFKHRIAPALAALAVALVSPASAQTQPGTNVGTLTCKMGPSIGLIFGSRQKMACRFVPNCRSASERAVSPLEGSVLHSVLADVGRGDLASF